MTAPAAPPVTSVTASISDVITAITAVPTHGVYLYIDTTTPSGAGVAASTFATDTAALAYYEGLSAVKVAEETDTTVLAAVRAVDHVFRSTPNRKVKIIGGAQSYTDTDLAASHRDGVIAN